MNQDFANHFLALLSCILQNRNIFTYTNQTTYSWLILNSFPSTSLQTFYFFLFISANNLFGLFYFCKQFFSGFLIPPPPKKNGPSLTQTSFCEGSSGDLVIAWNVGCFLSPCISLVPLRTMLWLRFVTMPSHVSIAAGFVTRPTVFYFSLETNIFSVNFFTTQLITQRTSIKMWITGVWR